MKGARSEKKRENKATDMADVTQGLICHTHRLLPVKHPLPSNSTDLNQRPPALFLNHLALLTFTLPKRNLVCLSICLSEHPTNSEHLGRTCRAVKQHFSDYGIYNYFQWAKLQTAQVPS